MNNDAVIPAKKHKAGVRVLVFGVNGDGLTVVKPIDGVAILFQ